MTRFMQYSTENATILIELFRHKLAHLAQPNPLIRYGLERVTWRHHQHDRQFHLKKIPLDSGSEIADVHTGISQLFMSIISDIKDFAKDISKILEWV